VSLTAATSEALVDAAGFDEYARRRETAAASAGEHPEDMSLDRRRCYPHSLLSNSEESFSHASAIRNHHIPVVRSELFHMSKQ
jgi:hypothetical protein